MIQNEQDQNAIQGPKEGKLKWILAATSFFIALVTYVLTMAPTVSFWDCGEFVSSANILGIPHPPGTPFFVLIGRAAIILFAFIPDIAARLNFVSAFSSAISVMIAFLIGWESIALAFAKKSPEPKLRALILSCGALTSAFLVAFSDTFWFSAVEAEVYGASMAILFGIVLLCLWWIPRRETVMGDKLLILMTYLSFVGIGVHLYTMLFLPCVFLFVLILKPQLRTLSAWPFWVVPAMLFTAAVKVDKFPLLLLIALVGTLSALVLVKPEQKYPWRLSFWMAFVALIGYSTHAYLPVRSSQNPAIDESNPEVHQVSDVINLPFLSGADEKDSKFEDFLSRKQYIQSSMIDRAMFRRANPMHQFFSFAHMGYGGYQLAQYFPWKVGGIQYDRSQNDTNWVVTAGANEPNTVLGVDFNTQMANFFGSGRENVTWRNYVRPVILVLAFNAVIFFSILALYRREKSIAVLLGSIYLVSSVGLIWYLNMADGTRLDSEIYLQYVPKIKEQFKAANGHSPSDQELSEVLAQYPKQQLEVRERDYFYTPAYMMMGIILGIGLGLGLAALARKRDKIQYVKPLGLAAAALSLAVPATANWTSHNRSGNHTPWDFAWNFLQSVPKDGILFTFGDNDTFPLWALQETWNVRKDVRVVNTSLGQTDWYIKQMMEQEPKVNLVFFKDPMTMARVEAGEPHPAAPYIEMARATLDTLAQLDAFMQSPAAQAALKGQGTPDQVKLADSLNQVLKSRSYERHVWQAFYEQAVFPQVDQVRGMLPMLQKETLRLSMQIAQTKDSAQLKPLQDTLNAYQMQMQMGQSLLARIYKSKDELKQDSALLVGKLMALRESLTKDSNPSAQARMQYSMLSEEAKGVVGMLQGGKTTLGTDELLILDVILHNQDKSINFAMGGSSIGLDGDLQSVGWVRTLSKNGDLTPAMAYQKTDSLVKNVFKYRGLGDGTAHLDGETLDQMWGMHFNTLVYGLGRPYLEARNMLGLSPQQMPMSVALPNLPQEAQAAIRPRVMAAMPALERLQKLFPSRMESYLYKAEAQALLGQTDEARKTLSACAAQVTKNESGRCSEAASQLSSAMPSIPQLPASLPSLKP